jgi:PDGLE domain-containing protein
MRWFTIVALAVAIGLATAASPFASSAPDGLNRVAADNGFAARAEEQHAPLIDYQAALGGFAGTLIVFVVGAGVARAVRR